MYKKSYPYNPTAKFTQSYAVGYEYMTNDADVNSSFNSFCYNYVKTLMCAMRFLLEDISNAFQMK